MFHNVFSKKRREINLKRSNSMKNVLLKGKIVFGYCGGHDIIIIVFLIDGFKEGTIRLCSLELCQWQKVWKIYAWIFS